MSRLHARRSAGQAENRRFRLRAGCKLSKLDEASGERLLADCDEVLR
jgi:hypothetical protein